MISQFLNKLPLKNKSPYCSKNEKSYNKDFCFLGAKKRETAKLQIILLITNKYINYK